MAGNIANAAQISGRHTWPGPLARSPPPEGSGLSFEEARPEIGLAVVRLDLPPRRVLARDWRRARIGRRASRRAVPDVWQHARHLRRHRAATESIAARTGRNRRRTRIRRSAVHTDDPGPTWRTRSRLDEVASTRVGVTAGALRRRNRAGLQVAQHVSAEPREATLGRRRDRAGSRQEVAAGTGRRRKRAGALRRRARQHRARSC